MRMTVFYVALVAGVLALLQSSSEAKGPGGFWKADEEARPAMVERATPSGEPESPPGTSSGDAELGRRVYLARCTACHNADPSRDGQVGPAVKGAPLELVRTRVLWAAYPSGYAPKRGTRIMPPQPELVSRINDLAAYLRAR
jgi:mono/diheme cytochrome c family protein